ncbi:CAAX prenyl protease 1 homolog [Copidosoma floridanum]|uniref:CAAX prenyl protease 1 homolog n=1 Tax=Copidosoma floridanum TaxID=29053 RepID=UPI0006C9A885|nr:CAAX prenyl protease 1 homolog [Copidosoma floridanum]
MGQPELEKISKVTGEHPTGNENMDISDFFRQHILAEIVILTWIFFLWEFYLSYRQRRLMKRLVQRPSILDNLISDEEYQKSRTYGLDKNTFGIIEDLYSNIIYTIFKISWGVYICWNYGADLIELIGLNRNSEIYVTAGYLVITTIFSTVVGLPCTIYNTFVLEQKHEFNQQTPLFFIRDQITKFLVGLVITVPLTCGIVWIVKNGGDFFYIYVWLFCVVMSLVLMMIYPEFIAPLFDKYTPLPEGNLKVEIEKLAASLGFPLYKLYIVEGSRRSTHSNAYLYGFYKNKRIVLFDTLVAEYQRKKLEEEEKAENEKASNENPSEDIKEDTKVIKEKKIKGCETDEIIAILGHELGHWHYSHAIIGFIFAQIALFVNFILFSFLMDYTPLYEAFGFTNSKPVIVGLTVVVTYVLAPLNSLLGWLMTMVSRRNEFQADAFARRLGYTDALGRALVKLFKDNSSYPLYDWLYSNWHNSHPPLLERLDALKKDD